MELVIVIAIIGIILSTAISMGINMRKARALSQAVDELVYQLQRAKLTAIKEFTPASIIIDAQRNRYLLDRTSTCTATGEAKVFSLSNDSGRAVYDTSYDLPDCVTFTPSGVASNTGAIYLTDKDGERKYRIRVSGAGGISKHIYNRKANSWYQPGG